MLPERSKTSAAKIEHIVAETHAAPGEDSRAEAPGGGLLLALPDGRVAVEVDPVATLRGL